jgi:REP element-mobilizing transposase RayT
MPTGNLEARSGCSGTAVKAGDGPRGWHSRGYLAHFDGGSLPQMVTFRLVDSLPKAVLGRWENELATLPEARACAERRERIERFLDAGAGAMWLSRPEIANLVEGALLHFHGKRYQLDAWVVMPNHVHVLLTTVAGRSLSEVVHSWKSFTGNRANRMLGRVGPFWQPDYYDRFIRNESHFRQAIEYIKANPVNAGLCNVPENWPFGSARFRSAGFHPTLTNCGQDGRAPRN